MTIYQKFQSSKELKSKEMHGGVSCDSKQASAETPNPQSAPFKPRWSKSQSVCRLPRTFGAQDSAFGLLHVLHNLWKAIKSRQPGNLGLLHHVYLRTSVDAYIYIYAHTNMSVSMYIERKNPPETSNPYMKRHSSWPGVISTNLSWDLHLLGDAFVITSTQ